MSSVALKLDDFRPQKTAGAFRSWLWRITRNQIIDLIRKQSHNPRAKGGSSALLALQQQIDPSSIPVDEPTENFELEQLYQRGLAQVRDEFEAKTWAIFQRAVLDNVATDLVALEFKVQAATVRQVRSRVLRRLRQQLGDND